jgi:hypothetical protein
MQFSLLALNSLFKHKDHVWMGKWDEVLILPFPTVCQCHIINHLSLSSLLYNTLFGVLEWVTRPDVKPPEFGPGFNYENIQYAILHKSKTA